MKGFHLLVVVVSSIWLSACLSGEPSGKTPNPGDAFDAASLSVNQSFDMREMPFSGQLIKTLHWTDGNGQNTLILSGIEANQNGDKPKAEIFANHYVEKDGEVQRLWKIHDWVDQCECDCDVLVVDSTLHILDINKDGIAESSFVYLLNDRCDASPVTTKLMMHSGATKLVVRGSSQLYLLPPTEELQAMGVDVSGMKLKEFDPAFEKADAKFRDYASAYWDNYIERENAMFKTRMEGQN
ncbi:MAG: hypothetical protein AAFV95_23045 [Bacteroidota bacterium]